MSAAGANFDSTNQAHPISAPYGCELDVNNDIALGLVSELLRMALILALPLLGVILVIGVVISILQVVTQVQDPSVAFVPKLAVFAIVLGLLAPWMLNKLTGYGVEMFSRLAQ
jgi:flagellar biosynthesis protein FliQ